MEIPIATIYRLKIENERYDVYLGRWHQKVLFSVYVRVDELMHFRLYGFKPFKRWFSLHFLELPLLIIFHSLMRAYLYGLCKYWRIHRPLFFLPRNIVSSWIWFNIQLLLLCLMISWNRLRCNVRIWFHSELNDCVNQSTMAFNV